MLSFPVPENATKYQVLGVDTQASQDELHVAYRRLALLYHPDRHPEEEKEASGKIFARIASSYGTLSNPEERCGYDLALSRNEEYRESGGDEGLISLAEILAGIRIYEHMFAEDSLEKTSRDLNSIVQSRLITEIGEEIVDCWALPSAPGNETHRGTFNNGALVLTNLRVLMPYTFSWEEVHGNVKTTYKGAGMPTLPLPALERIEVVSKKRVKRKLLITFQYKEGQISISPHRTNLSKLLLVAQLWGVPIEAREDDARLAELRWALWTPWLSGVIVLALLFLGAAVLGLFGDGMVDSMGDFSDFLRRWALLQWAAIGIAAFSGRRLMRWTFAYSAIDLAETLRNLPRSNDPRPGR